MCDYDHVTTYRLPSNGAIIQCGRKAHAIKAGRTSRVQHSPMLSSGYARKHNNEEGEPVMRDIYTAVEGVGIYFYSRNSSPSSPRYLRNLTDPKFFVNISAGFWSPFIKKTQAYFREITSLT